VDNKRAKIVIFVLIFIFIMIPLQVMSTDFNIFLNGEEISKELDPFFIDGKLLVSARSLAKILGAELYWFESIKTLSLQRDHIEIKMMVDNPYIQINNTTHKNKVGLVLKNSHTYVDIEEVVKGFGYLIKKEGERNFYIFKPESFIKEVVWKDEGQILMIKMDKISPYRVVKCEDPKKLIIEVDKAVLASDFIDRLSNKNFYLKINKSDNKARLQFVISSEYPIPFQLDGGIEEDGNNLIINFLPHLIAINWTKENSVEIIANGEIKKPAISLFQEPRRIVLDIPTMMLSNFDINLPDNEWIKDIRASQFEYDPVILRVVIELKEESYLQLGESKDNKILVLRPSQRTEISGLELIENIIKFKTDNIVKPEIFTLYEPERLVINLLNTIRDNNIPDKIDINNELVKSIRTARFNEETVRIVVDLKEITGYRWQQNKLDDGYEHQIILKNSFHGIEISQKDCFTNISIDMGNKVEYEVNKFSYPHRLVVDIRDVRNNLEEIKLPEPEGIIKNIRASQFSTDPEIIRIVFELDKYYTHKVNSINPDSLINISIAEEKPVEKREIIVIDPGHGGFDPGAIGASGLMEKELNLDIALKVSQLLKNKGKTVYLTRNKDEFISLKARVEKANEINASIFVSIHVNSFNKRYSEGTETFFAPNKKANSLHFAKLVQEKLVKELKLKDRGVKEDNLYVIKNTNVPAILVEIAFLSNPHEEALLMSELFKQRAAEAIVRGIIDYLD
jgi:N-acetylmuramoyl-L-alanine amidase